MRQIRNKVHLMKHLKAGTKKGSTRSTGTLMTRCETIYNNMLASGVAPEQARMVLPQSMMTEWYWTGSLAAFARVVSQRISEDAQYECRVVAEKIDQLLVNHEPISYSWSCLTGRV